MDSKLAWLKENGSSLLALAAYGVLADAAMETLIGRSPANWFVAASVGVYFALSWFIRRRLDSPTKGMASALVFLIMLAVTSWLPGTFGRGLILMGQSTSALLGAVTAGGVLTSAVALVGLGFMPRAARWGIGSVAVYSLAGFFLALEQSTPYSELFRRGSLWTGFPFWLQGAFIGAFLLTPAAIIFQVVNGLRRMPGGARWRHMRTVALSMCVVMAVSSFESCSSAIPKPTSVASHQAPAGAPVAPVISSPTEELDRPFDRLEELRNRFDRSQFDVEAKSEALGRDPGKVFAFVRDEISYEVYSGVLRGARGALLSKAGNSLDKSLLLADLLKHSGFGVRFVSGMLERDKAATLVKQMLNAKPSPAAPEPQVDQATSKAINDSPDIYNQLNGQLQAKQEEIDGMMELVADHRQYLNEMLRSGGVTLRGDLQSDLEALIREATQHVWVEYQRGNEWVDLDPSFATAAEGQSVAQARSIWPEIPDNLRQKVTFRVEIEQQNHSDLRKQTILEATYPTADLVAASISFVNKTDTAGDLASVAQAIKFLPVITVNGKQELKDGFDLHGNVVPAASFTGAAPASGTAGAWGGAASALSGIGQDAPAPAAPAASAATEGTLTAEWLKFVVTGPGINARSYVREVLDRIGDENRTGRRAREIKTKESDQLSIRYQLSGPWAILVEPGFLSQDFLDDTLISQISAKKSLVAANSLAGGDATTQKALATKYQDASKNDPSVELFALSAARKGLGDRLAAAEFPTTRYYRATPGIALFKTALDPEPEGKIAIQRGFDIVENAFRAVDGSDASQARQLNLALGVMETHLERALASDFSDVLSSELNESENAAQEFSDAPPLNTTDVFDAASEAQTPIVLLRPANVGAMSALKVSAEAKERIRKELMSGRAAIVPNANVLLGEDQTVGWWRIDPATGASLGMMESGGGQAMTESAVLNGDATSRCSAVAMFGQKLCTAFNVYGTVMQILLVYQLLTGEVSVMDLVRTVGTLRFWIAWAVAKVISLGCKRLSQMCFVAGTLVQVAGASPVGYCPRHVETKPIERIAPGDLVVTRDPTTQRTEVKPVLRTTKRVAPGVMTLTLADADTGRVQEQITASPEHPFYVSGLGFVPAAQLGIGNAIVTRAGPPLVVRSIEHHDRPGGYEVYNFEVQSDHTYFVGESGSWVHNGCGPNGGGNGKQPSAGKGKLPKPPKGRGAVPKSKRDPKRVWSKSENDGKLAKQGGKCANCGGKIKPGDPRYGHHIHRHADGARTVDKEHAVVCDPCHKDLHHD